MKAPGLPHHRQRVDERRTDAEDGIAVRVAVGFVLGLLMVIAAVAYVARAV